ncbi:MAG: dephospho-CoA kinase [Bacteroidota bacterium]|jgi:dephospho-CoA kinase
MLKIGLTGGIGAGKSTVASIFKVLGVPVFDADATAKNILNTDLFLREQVISAFGSETYKNGLLDRKYLATLVFNNSEQLAKLNALVHPATIAAMEKWAFGFTDRPYIIKEAALLFEAGTHEGLDYIIGVTAPVELRIARVMQRDHVLREEVLGRMQHQLDDTEKMKRCNFVIDNNETSLVIPQVLALHEQFIS